MGDPFWCGTHWHDDYDSYERCPVTKAGPRMSEAFLPRKPGLAKPVTRTEVSTKLPTVLEARTLVEMEYMIPRDIRFGSLLNEMLLPLARASGEGRLMEAAQGHVVVMDAISEHEAGEEL